jgi:HD-GYP domain-containing protein (c-di-GMP phosphodiesterase class II)
MFDKTSIARFLSYLIAIIFSIVIFYLTKSFWLFIISLVIPILLNLHYEYTLSKSLRYEKIYRTISYLSRFHELKPLLDFVIHSISEILNAERTTLFLVNKETNSLWTIVAESLEIKEITLSIGQGIAGYVAQTGETVCLNSDPYKDKRFLSLIDQKTGYKTKKLLCAPVYDNKQKIIAVVEVINKKNNSNFTKNDEDILKTFCTEIGNTLSNVFLYESYQQLLESLIKSFAAAVDARDPVTRGHSIRTTKYAVNIGTALKLSPRELKIIEYASLLHDVGKIGVPDYVLLKAEKFNKEEYEVMKSHVLVTKEILSKISFPEEYREVPQIASLHHEFLDGSGYPFGLKKDEIPLLARIVCIADIYDALISYDRPYKPPITQQKALETLKEMVKEGKLDPEIVNLFIEKKLYEIERREFVRVNKEFSFSWRKLGPDDIKSILPIIAKTKNISAGGLRFVTKEELSINSFIEVELYLPNYTIELLAKVVHCTQLNNNGDQEVGIMFINMPKETEIQLNKYLLSSK